MTLFRENLFCEGDATTRVQIVHWWIGRLFDFNLAVGTVGVVTWLLVMFAGSAAVKPGVDFEEPLAMIFGPFVYGALANLSYFMGPAADLVFFSGRPRVWLFKTGFFFSLGLTALPGLWALTAWLITVYTGQKMD
jgi:hypothetical protein